MESEMERKTLLFYVCWHECCQLLQKHSQTTHNTGKSVKPPCKVLLSKYSENLN